MCAKKTITNMEDWEEKLIMDNLTNLVQHTECNHLLLVSLKSQRILSESDINELEAKNLKYEKNKKLYDFLKARKKIFPFLQALQENGQYNICDILWKGAILHTSVMFQTKSILLTEILTKFHTPIPKATCKLHKDLVNPEIKELELVKNHVQSTPKSYIQRVISQSRLISSDIFRNPKNDVFAIKGLQRYELTALANGKDTDVSSNIDKKVTVQFIFLEHDSHFKKICNKIIDRPVHMIEYSAKQFKWIKSKGSLAEIRNHICDEPEPMKEENFIRECLESDSPVCIADTPGMGKSLLLTKMASVKMVENTLHLVRFMQLRDLLNVLEVPVTKESVCNALANVSSDYEVGKEVVVNALKSEETDSYLFLDGFDEVPFHQISVVGEIFNCIKQLKKIRVYTATRLHMKQDLEDMVGCLGFNILPFRDNEQVEFLVKVWENEGIKQFGPEGKTETRLQEFASVCLESLKKLTSDNGRDIAGIPLLLRIVSEVHRNEAIDYSRDTSLKTPNLSRATSSIFEMYQVFMNDGFSKIEKNLENPNLKEKIKAHHDICAVEELFAEFTGDLRPMLVNDGDELNNWSLFLPGVLELKNNNAKFVHRTFAEYLVAEFITKSLHKEHDGNTWNPNIYRIVDQLLFKNVLAIREREELIELKIGVNIAVTLYEFKQPTVCYFLNAFCQSRPTVNDLFKKTPQKNIKENSNMSTHAVISMVDDRISHINPWPALFINSAKHAGVSMTKQLTAMLFKSTRKLPAELFTDLERDFTVETPLTVAAQRGDYELFQYLWNSGGFRIRFLEGHENILMLIHKCVLASGSDFHETDFDRFKIINFILSDIGTWKQKNPAKTYSSVHPTDMEQSQQMSMVSVLSNTTEIENLLTMDRENKFLPWPALFVLTAKYAKVEMTRHLTDFLKNAMDKLPVDLNYRELQQTAVTPLLVAAQNGDFVLFEYLWNNGGFRKDFFESKDDVMFLIHECVLDSYLESQNVVSDKLKIVNMIISDSGTHQLQSTSTTSPTRSTSVIPYMTNNEVLMSEFTYNSRLNTLIPPQPLLEPTFDFAKMYTAAIVSGNTAIGNFLIQRFETECATLPWPELLIVAARCARVEGTKQLTDLFRVSYVGNNLPIALLEYSGGEYVAITPLHIAAQTGDYNLFEHLWNSGGFKQVFIDGHKNGAYLLHECVSGSSADAPEIVNSKLQIIHLILSDLDTPKVKFIIDKRLPHDDSTALLQNNIHVDLFNCLTSNGAQLVHKNKRRENVLHIAAKNGNIDVVKYLVTKYSKFSNLLDMSDIDGNTPLHLAVLKRENQHIQQILIEAGANIFTVNEKGCNPFVNSMRHGNGLELLIVQEIGKRHPKFFSLFSGVGLKCLLTNSQVMVWDWNDSLVGVAKYLIQRGANVKCRKVGTPWILEQSVSNRSEMVDSIVFTKELLIKLKELGILCETIDNEEPGLFERIVAVHGSYEKLMLSLVMVKQMKPFLIMKQCLKSDENDSVWFVTPPAGVLDFILDPEIKVLILQSTNSDYTETRIRDTVYPDVVVQELGVEDNTEQGLAVFLFPSIDNINEMLIHISSVSTKAVLIVKELVDLSHIEPKTRKLIQSAYDEVRWDDLSELVKHKFASRVEELNNCSFFCFLGTKNILKEINRDFSKYINNPLETFCEDFVKSCILDAGESNFMFIKSVFKMIFPLWINIFKQSEDVPELRHLRSQSGDLEILLKDMLNYVVAFMVVDKNIRMHLDSDTFVEFLKSVIFKCKDKSCYSAFVNPTVCANVNALLSYFGVEGFQKLLEKLDRQCLKNLIFGSITNNYYDIMKLVVSFCTSQKIEVEIDDITMGIVIMNRTLEFVEYLYDFFVKSNEHLIVKYHEKLWSSLRLAGHRGDKNIIQHVVDYHKYNQKLIELLSESPTRNSSGLIRATLAHQTIVEETVPEVIWCMKSLSMTLLYQVIDFGANLCAQDQDGYTFIHCAPRYLTPLQYHKLVEYLVRINKGECLTVRDKQGATVLHHAVLYFEVLPETLDLFKLQSVDFNAVTDENANSSSVLHHAIKGNRSTILINKLVECEANVRTTNKNGNSLLHFAALSGNLSAIPLLVSYGCSVKSVNKNKWTPLHKAFSNRKGSLVEVVRLLVEHNSDVNAKGFCGRTPLHCAVEFGKSPELDKAIKFLSSKGADVNIQDNIGNTMLLVPLGHRTPSDYHQIVQVVENVSPKCLEKTDNAGLTALHRAVEFMEIQSDTLKLLIKHVDINAVDKYGNPPLFDAIENGRSQEFISMMIDHGANPKVRNNKSNALHWAAMYGNIPALKYFLDRKEIDVNEINTDKETALHCAFFDKKNSRVHEVVQILLEAGGDLNLTCKVGRYPLDLAVDKTKNVEKRTIKMMKNWKQPAHLKRK